MIFFYSNQTGTTLYFRSLNKKKNQSYFFLNQYNEFSNFKNYKKIKRFEEIILFIRKFNPKFFFISATKDKIENQIIQNSKKFNYNVISIIDYPTNLKMNKRFISLKKKFITRKNLCSRYSRKKKND